MDNFSGVPSKCFRYSQSELGHLIRQQTRPVQTSTLQQFLLWFVLCVQLHTVFCTHLAWLPNIFLHGFNCTDGLSERSFYTVFSLLSNQALQLGRTSLISTFAAFLSTLLRYVTGTTSLRRDPSWLKSERAYSFERKACSVAWLLTQHHKKLVIWRRCGLSCDPEGPWFPGHHLT